MKVLAHVAIERDGLYAYESCVHEWPQLVRPQVLSHMIQRLDIARTRTPA